MTRVQTVYGMAVVTGHNGLIPKVHRITGKALSRQMQEAHDECQQWKRQHRGAKPLPPKDKDYIKFVNSLYRSMLLGGGMAADTDLPKTEQTLREMRDG